MYKIPSSYLLILILNRVLFTIKIVLNKITVLTLFKLTLNAQITIY